jgi:hypothetical protein
VPRARVVILAALLAVGLSVPLAGAAMVDKGLRTPPKTLPPYHKALWMSEWVACWRPETMEQLALELRMRPQMRRAKSPQAAAVILSTRAMRFLYEDPLELRIARDGCRNGILWRYYHQH